MYCSGIFRDELSKTTKYVSQYIRCPVENGTGRVARQCCSVCSGLMVVSSLKCQMRTARNVANRY